MTRAHITFYTYNPAHIPTSTHSRHNASPFKNNTQMQCLCDRYWAQLEACRLPGAQMLNLPFVCPMDHIFEPALMVLPVYAIHWREHSFFDNPRGPAAHARDVALLRDAAEPPGEGAVAAGLQIVTAPAQTDGQLRQVTRESGAAGIRRIHVQNPARIWKGFEAESVEAAFQDHFLRVLSVWCCSPIEKHPVIQYRDWYLRTPEQRQTLDAIEGVP